MSKLLTDQELADALGLTAHMVLRLRRVKKIPAVKLGYRTFRYRLESVEAALSKMEVKAINTGSAR